MKIVNCKFKILLLICLFAYLLIRLFPKTAYANQLSLGVYPPEIQIEANPPATITHPVTIVNNSEDPVSLTILFKSFQNSPANNGDVLYKDQKNFLSTNHSPFLKNVTVVSDIGETINQIELSPKQQKTLTLSLAIPSSEPTSDQYFSVLFLTKGTSTDNGNQNLLTGGIAMHVLAAIGPKEKPSGSIKTFSAPFFLQQGPVPFTVELTNNTPHYISPKGIILIKNMFGQQIGKVDLLPVTILSHTDRFIPDTNNLSDTQALWKEKFLLGPYTATLTTALSDQGPVLHKTIYFIALPIQGITGLIILSIVTLSIAVRVRRKIQ